MNHVRPRLKRREIDGHNGKEDEDDNNEGMLRKTLITATIRRESECAGTSIPGGGGV